MMAFVLMFAIIAIFGLYTIYQDRRYKRFYCCVNAMLDDIIYGRRVMEAALTEEKESLIANKILRVEDKMNLEIGQAVEEREKIKMLIADMSHQLKTPLANVMMYGEILKDMSLDDTKREVFQGKLKEQTEKIAWIMNSLFKMTQLEEGFLEFDICEHDIQDTILRAVNDIYEKALARNVEIQIADLEENTVIHNEKWTAEVLENLLENAVKYSAKGSKILVAMERQTIYTQIKIIDSGIGIDTKEQLDIFKRFYRSKDVENFEGTGIGLYLSRLIVEREKGYITVESTKGKGSCFSVFLPNGKK